MQITARYTSESIQEATDLHRHLWQRAFRLATSARALVYLIAGLWLGFLLVARGLRTPTLPQDVYAGAVVLFLVTAIAALTRRARSSQIEKALRAHPEQVVTVDSAGLTKGGSFESWSAFSTFHEGRTLVVLARADRAPALTIPTDTLTPSQTGELRSILLSHLPERL